MGLIAMRTLEVVALEKDGAERLRDCDVVEEEEEEEDDEPCSLTSLMIAAPYVLTFVGPMPLTR